MELTWLSAAPTEETVTIGSSKYVLKEASAAASAEHKDATFRAVKVNNSTNVATFGGIADADLVLLSRCLYENNAPGMYIPVTVQTIRGWANRVTEPLIEHLKKISGMQAAETANSLHKQREAIDAKLAKLGEAKADSEEEPDPKNSPSDATPS